MTGQNKSILIIDDEKDLLRGLATFLRRSGYSLLTASNGADGIHLAQKYCPDIIVCDIMMPKPNGYEVRKTLSEDPKTAHIPFIFLTARNLLADRLFGLELNVDDYITKPFNNRELLARIEAILRRIEVVRQQARKEHESQMDQIRRSILKNTVEPLRGPLETLIKVLNAVSSDQFSADPAKQQLLQQAALTSAHRLNTAIGNLLALDKLDKPVEQVVREPIDLSNDFYKPIAQCLQHWRSRNLDVHVTVESQLTIYAPRQGFQLATMHLFDNACKFSPNGGRVDVTLTNNGIGGCILTVTDQGPGIPVELREKVFEQYFQIPSDSSSPQPGLGVGLTIARGFAQSLGGDVIILDMPQGTQVQMVIPPGPPSQSEESEHDFGHL